MIGKASVGARTRQRAVLGSALSLGLLTCIAAQTASAADCPGNPDAIGTSRTLVVDPREHPRIGTMQYAETLPLRDHEVVLSFDDGPLPRNSNQILAILASQCVKANFFLIGQMARTYPEGVRKLRDAGHTIGTHSQDHPLTMNKMPIEHAKQEIDDGIASVKAALGPDADKTLGPFFRIPGLERATAVEDYLASQGIQTWSADFPADDWRHISSSRVYDLAIQRIEAKGKGILLLHDIQARTVAALPKILATLKARGYHIVHVVPATPDRPATPTEPQEWRLHPTLETVAISHWPKVPNFVFASADAFAVPALSDFAGTGGELVPQAEPFDRVSHRGRGIPLPQEAPWRGETLFAMNSAATALPVPAQTVFEIPEMPRPTAEAVALLAPPAKPTIASARESQAQAISVSATDSRRAVRGTPVSGQNKRSMAASHQTRRATAVAAHGRRTPLKHLVQVKKRNV
ncbi:polysaccharide deacetylase family protein [Bradyrhizobium canariense]|uniref:Chitooligosaccharide deacetylase n=1 Tax=Bradyrhizobium canariense TaxID=255045 RepID=A0A1H1NX35_9BRAD|nr:polysaccharide deacetylase family protein [Bradyrhizobium canariense]SDS03522.1 Peptidoglycan/xylan/chitin deacetylase, PgdA/CDA1 family [Bradyrhizobium canariense]